MLVAVVGIRASPGQRALRLDDLVCTFTVATMLDWYRDGQAVPLPSTLARPRRPR